MVTGPWYRDERLLIPLAILLAGMALVAMKMLLSKDTVQAVVRTSFQGPVAPAKAPTLAPQLNRTRPTAPLPVAYTNLEGIWTGRYEQVGDSGDFSEFKIVQRGDDFVGEGATRSRALNETAAYRITGSLDGLQVRFTDELLETKPFWCEHCTYVGTVNAEYTRIELRGTCPGLCPGGIFILERLPPDVPPTLL